MQTFLEVKLQEGEYGSENVDAGVDTDAHM